MVIAGYWRKWICFFKVGCWILHCLLDILNLVVALEVMSNEIVVKSSVVMMKMVLRKCKGTNQALVYGEDIFIHGGDEILILTGSDMKTKSSLMRTSGNV